ncbi:hypothetical protein I4U23_011786 [Adineta vaga]|nr:hypothetical protein I4U23_011786 [Adineta vaga]
MSSPVGIVTVIKLIKYGMDIVATVTSNKETCATLADDLSIIYEILTGLNERDKLAADKYKYSCVMNKLYRITTRSNILFDKCTSGKKMIRIRHYLSATPIKNELQKLQKEIPVVIGMLNLVFHVKQNASYTRGGTSIPAAVDESIFDEEEEQDEEYYVNDDEDDKE